MTVLLQIRHDQVDFFLGQLDLVGRTTEFQLRTTGKDLDERETFFEQVEFSVVDAQEFDGVDGFEVDDGIGQSG